MITLTGLDPLGARHVVLGLTRDDVSHLTAGTPLAVSHTAQHGFPPGLDVTLVFADTEAQLRTRLETLLGDEAPPSLAP